MERMQRYSGSVIAVFKSVRLLTSVHVSNRAHSVGESRIWILVWRNIAIGIEGLPDSEHAINIAVRGIS